jgi:poly(3-hydroxybutyrate) depolymerase
MASRNVLKIASFMLAGLGFCGQIAFARAAQQPAPQVDPRVEQRTYLFEDTNEELPYAVFVSSKVRPDQESPLIVALHGLGGNPNTLLRGNALDLAEDGGYILVGPMGYSPGGWYGTPFGQGGRGRGRGANTDGPNAGTGRGAQPQNGGRGFGAGAGGGTAVTDPAEVTQLSEKDVMNVLEMIREEFNVDDERTYLMGHSMGGAGTMYLGVKYASNWAAIGAIAPATAPAGLRPETFSLEPARDVPVILVQGDEDTLVPVEGARRWVEQMEELDMTYQYIETPGGTHGSVIGTGMPDIFAFFAEHTK